MQKTIHMACSAALMAVALSACSARTPQEEADDAVSIYSPAHIQQLAAADYEEAVRLTEEGLLKGRLSVFTACCLRANLAYHYTEDYPESARWLRRALEQEEAQEPGTRTELLYHLVTILRAAKDYTGCLSACAEGKEMAHNIGLVYTGHAFDFIAGSCLFSIGEDETGLKMMKNAIAGAFAVAGSEEEYGHLVFFTGGLISSYIAVENEPAALEECAVYERLLSVMERNYPDTPESYLDRSWFYLDLYRAVCYARTGEATQASEAFALACGRRFAASESGKIRFVDYYAAIGDPDAILKIYEDVPYTEADTVSRAWRLRLARLRDAYANAGRKGEAASLTERYEALSVLIEAKENAEGIHVKAAEYDAQHYRLTLGDTIDVLKKYRRSITGILILLFAAVVVLIFLSQWMSRRKEAQYREEAEILKNDLGTLRKQVSLIAEKELYSGASAAGGDKKEFSFTELIEGRKIYLNKNLNRESIAALLGLTQTEISRMLTEIEPGLTFPDYIKGLRIRHALELLGKNPDIPIAELADRCGFYSIRTLQRSFHAVTGKTPSKYARDLRQQSKKN